jgi:steroid Delta-isomerase
MPRTSVEDEMAQETLRRYFAGLSSLDPIAISAVFEEDGEIDDPVGSGIRRGRAAVADYFSKGLCSAAKSVDIEILYLYATGGSVAAHWRMDAVSPTGARAHAEGIDVLELSGEGLIRRAEGYWDQLAFRKALSS